MQSNKTHQVNTLLDLFLEKLRNIYDEEKQIVATLPIIARTAHNRHLKEALGIHVEETHNHVRRIELIFEKLGRPALESNSEAMAHRLDGTLRITAIDDVSVRDAAIAAEIIGIERYEISSYEALLSWSDVMGEEGISEIIKKTIGEEERMNSRLMDLTQNNLYQEACFATV